MSEIAYFPNIEFTTIDLPEDIETGKLQKKTSAITNIRCLHDGVWYRIKIKCSIQFPIEVYETDLLRLTIMCNQHLLDDVYTFMILKERVPLLLDLVDEDGSKVMVIDETQIDEGSRIKAYLPKLKYEK